MLVLPQRTAPGDRYAVAMGELWGGLARTLARLDRLAEAPEQLSGENVVDALRRLQYGLHSASENAYGLVPPTGAESAHAELAEALAGARDATAEVADAVAAGGVEAAAILVHEWRGALFRVRLARLRLAGPRQAPEAAPAAPEKHPVAAPLVAFLLALGGALAFVLGATLGAWPVGVLGVAAICGSLLVYRP